MIKLLIINKLTIASILLSAFKAEAAGADEAVAEIRFDHHHFSPTILVVKAGRPFAIKVVNSSKETIEFESFKLNREKVVRPGEAITVHLPALRAGSYDFFDDFHSDVPEGAIAAQ